MVTENLKICGPVERLLPCMHQHFIQLEDEQGPVHVGRFPVHRSRVADSGPGTYVDKKLASIARNNDLSKYVL